MPYRFGKLAARRDPRNLRFADYVSPVVPRPPIGFGVLTTVFQKLGNNNVAQLFPMDGNDTLGDCTIAGLAHADTVFHGLLGQETAMTAASAEALYFKLTGGQDTGLVEIDVLNFWRQNSINGDELLAYVSIDPKNHIAVKQAIRLFGGVYLGFTVTENCIQQFDAKKPWTTGPLTNDGHAVFAVGYDDLHLTVLTWGSTQEGTWAWWDQCVDECYALLPPEAKNASFAPGFDFAQLEADLKAVTS